ncbi:hypothetical protein [Acinetobacter larvae]|uniref:Uncharacterized protein n=1 Tax=Acinetobacter larvae TaxID=1789224 RepID=A0A1B2LZ99_9GAMM|nr:hypothetical protein [Acinetobacter larvae]AOA58229.1 hypothetical protein BFG52_07600 [Acinetobacter larvae]
MKKIALFFLILLNQPVWAAPTFLLEWDSKGEASSVNGVTYLGWDNDPSCTADIFIDEIKSFNYTAYDGNVEIITKNNHSPDGLFIYKKDLKGLNFDGNNHLSTLLKTKEKVVFIGEKCGSGGYFNIGSIIKLSEINKASKAP